MRNLFCLFLLTVCFVLSAPQLFAQETLTPNAATSTEQPLSKLLSLRKKLLQIEGQTPQEIIAQRSQLEQQILAEADRLLNEESTDDQTTWNAGQILLETLQDQSSRGEMMANLRMRQLPRQWQAHRNPKLQREGKLLELFMQLALLPRLSEQQKTELAENIIATIRTGEISQREISIAQMTARMFAQTDNSKLAMKVLNGLAADLLKSEEEDRKYFGLTLQGEAKRLGLIGQKLEMAGTTLENEPWSMEDFKGKVVVVQFWASWCAPCMEELTALKREYEQLHEDGFEVIGINLDDTVSACQKVVTSRDVPWPNLIAQEEKSRGMAHPLAIEYGVSTLPTLFLVNRDGVVVTTDAFDQVRDQLVPTLLKAEAGASE